MVDRANPDFLSLARRPDHFRQQFGAGSIHLQSLLKPQPSWGLSLSR